jgi:hypothetical protein
MFGMFSYSELDLVKCIVIFLEAATGYITLRLKSKMSREEVTGVKWPSLVSFLYTVVELYLQALIHDHGMLQRYDY